MITGKNKFVFVVPVFNGAKTVEQTLYSIAAQSYDNWHVILIDDMSTDTTVRTIKKFADGMWLSGRRLQYSIDVIVNAEKKWEVANVLQGIARCDDEDIVCRIDGDDWLTDTDALAMINSAYEQSGCDALWTGHRWGFSDKNISGPMSFGSDVYRHPWVSSHLKTFRKHLLNDVPYENFVNMDGELVRRAGDQSLYLPALHNSKNYVFLPRCVYHYSIDERDGLVYQTDDAKFQKNEADFIRTRGYVNSGPTWQEVISKTSVA